MPVELRDYQQRGIASIRSAFTTKRRVLFTLPTGGGKTMMFSSIADGVQRKQKRVLTIAHRRELLRQISGTMDRFGIPHAILNAESRGTPRAPVIVASVFTLVNRMKFMPEPDLIIIDEAHHAAIGTTWNRVLGQFPKARILGVTATPIRLDGKGLGDSFDTLVVGPSVAELTAMGWLSPAEYYSTPQALDLRGLKVRGGDYANSELAAAMDKPSITGDAVNHYRRLADGKRAVAFCCSVQHARDVAREFAAAGYPAEYIDGTMEDYARDAVLYRFQRGESRVLTSCDLISEGFDCPGIEVAILLRPTKSLGLYMQQVGRAIRPMSGKARTLVLDHAGNVKEHGLVDEVHRWSLDGKEFKERERVAAVRVCPKCYAMHAPAPMCPKCGYAYVTNGRTVEQVAGELERISGPEEIQAAMQEQEWRQRYQILINVGKARSMERPELWARNVMLGEYARYMASRKPDGEELQVNGLTLKERDEFVRMLRDTTNQLEMV